MTVKIIEIVCIFEKFGFDSYACVFCIYKLIAVIYFQDMNAHLILCMAEYIDVLYVFLR